MELHILATSISMWNIEKLAGSPCISYVHTLTQTRLLHESSNSLWSLYICVYFNRIYSLSFLGHCCLLQDTRAIQIVHQTNKKQKQDAVRRFFWTATKPLSFSALSAFQCDVATVYRYSAASPRRLKHPTPLDAGEVHSFTQTPSAALGRVRWEPRPRLSTARAHQWCRRATAMRERW